MNPIPPLPPTLKGIRFDAEAWYPEDGLRLFGRPFDGETLAKARKAGALEYREPSRGQRIYKGEWLTAWLEGKGASPPPAATR